MAFCTHCGKEVDPNAVVCTGCGCAVNGATSIEGIPQNEKIVSLIGYFSILFLVPLLAFKDSKFCRFHANQGAVLFLISIVFSIVGKIAGLIPIVGSIVGIVVSLVNIAVLVLAVLGMVYAIQGQQKELPIVGSIKLFQ